ncbi:MAG: phage virion morphogenesis protein [Rhodospirillales bacterium]
MALHLRYDLKELGEHGRRLNALMAAAVNTRPLMDEIGAYGEFSTRERFEKQHDPDGKPWKPNRRGGQILTDTARLRDSITHDAGDTYASWGTNVIYAGVHQEGAVIEPKNADRLAFRIGSQLIFAKRVEIPARPFLGLSNDDENEISRIAADYFREALQ